MATLIEIAAAQVDAQSRRLAALSRQISRQVRRHAADAPEARRVAGLIDQLAKDVDHAIDRWTSATISAAKAVG